MLIIAIFAITNGNYLAVINGYDSFGNICGTKHNKRFKNISLSGMDTSSKPFVLFFGWQNITTVLRICVNECPNEIIDDEITLVANWKLKHFKFCRYDFEMEKLINLYHYINYKSSIGPCPFRVILPSGIIKNRCIPLDYMDFVEEFYSYINNVFGTVLLVFSNIYRTWQYTFALSGFALLMSITLLILIFFQVKFALWTVVILVTISQGSLYAMMRYTSKNIPVPNDDSIVYTLLDEYKVNNSVLYTLMDLTLILMVFIVILCILLATSVSETKVFFDEARNCLKKVPSLLIFPFITLILLIGYLWIGTYVVIYIITASNPQILPFRRLPENDVLTRPFDNQYRVDKKVEYVEAEFIRCLFWIYIFGLLWTTGFILACEEFCLDAAVGLWYFKSKENAEFTNVIKLLLRYHLGSVVKGTTITPLLKIPRVLLFILNLVLNAVHLKFLKNFKGKLSSIENNIYKWNHTSYAFVAMDSTDFCSSRISEIFIGASRLKILNNVAKCIFFLAKLSVATVTCIIGVLLLKDHKDIYFYMAPILFNTIIAYFIAHVVFALFEKVMDMLLVCVCKDRQINNTSGCWKQSKFAELFTNYQEEIKNVIINVKPKLSH